MDVSAEKTERMKRRLRIVNIAVWCAVWVGIVVWTGTFRHWLIMFFQAFVPVMLWGTIHIALRPGGREA
jgi:hypothetical protein